MTDERRKTLQAGARIGAAAGVILSLVFGIVPGIYFGSYGSLVLLNHLADGSLEATTIVRMFTVVGIVMGIFCIGAVNIVCSWVSQSH